MEYIMMRKRNKPMSCREGKRYVIIEAGLKGGSRLIREVRFVGYCHSAGQVVVSWQGQNEVVWRKDLYEI